MSAAAKQVAANRAPERVGRPFQPGQSGNPSGRPKQVRELLELARRAVPQAFALAMSLLVNGDEDSRVRLEAAKFLTSYGLGAPPREPLDSGSYGSGSGLTDEQKKAQLEALLVRAKELMP